MKKVIAAVVFMLLVAVFAQFGASDVAFANDGKTMPPTRNCRFPRLTERRRTTS